MCNADARTHANFISRNDCFSTASNNACANCVCYTDPLCATAQRDAESISNSAFNVDRD